MLVAAELCYVLCSGRFSLDSGLKERWSLLGSAGTISTVAFGGELRELLHAGQLVDIIQSEAQQKILAGFVLHGAADDLLASGGGDEFAIEQRAQHTGRLDAANVGDLRSSDGLLVGDDGEGLKAASERRIGGLRLLAKARTTS